MWYAVFSSKIYRNKRIEELKRECKRLLEELRYNAELYGTITLQHKISDPVNINTVTTTFKKVPFTYTLPN